MKIYDKLSGQKAGQGRKVVTAAFLGDSVTQGCFEVYLTGESSLDTVYDYKSAYSTRFRELLNLLYPNLQVNIINAGISGDNSWVGLQRVEKEVLSYHPDLLVVSYGLNDAVGGGIDGVKAYAENLRGIFEKARAAECDVIYLTQNYMNTQVSCHIREPFLRNLAESFARVQNGKVLKAYYEEGKRVAESCGAVVCDCYAVWEQLEKASVDVTELLANKLNHPIREYHTYIALKLIEKILGIEI